VLLGEPSIQVGDAPPHRLERREAALFALLILEGPQARAVLAERVWSGVEPRKALSSLRQRLYRLRRATGHLLLTDDGPLNLAPGVKHDLHPDQVLVGPATEFELLGAHHYPPGEPLSERVQRLREGWLLMRSEYLGRAADAAEAAQRHDEASALAERLLLLQPASERAHRRCMRLHYLSGDRGQALAAYTRCRTRLQQLVGVGPDEETQALAAMIESSTMAAPRAATSVAQVALALPPRLVGREGALTRLRQAWDERRVVVLSGEAGIGKSRLALEFGRARGQLCWVAAQADERHTPYAWVTRWLRALGPPHAPVESWVLPELARLLPEWGDAADGALEPPRLRQAISALESAPRQADAWLFDDLQWIDAASLDLLLAHLDERGPAAHRLLMCVRDSAMPGPLAAWLRANATQVEHILLGPLSDDGVRQLLQSLQPASLPPESVPAAAASLMRLTGGHPLVLLEWLRAGHAPWRADGPHAAQAQARLAELLSARIGQLPPSRLRLLQLAALAGASASWPLVAAAAGRLQSEAVDDWHALVDAQFIQADGAPTDAVRQVVLATLEPGQRAAFARALAELMSAQGAWPERVASLWVQGGRWAEAADCWQRAALRARQLSRRAEEMALWDQAAHSHDLAGHIDRAWQARSAAAAAGLLVEDARQLTQRLQALLAMARTPDQQLDARLGQARACLNAHEGLAAREAARHARDLARQLGDEGREVAAITWHGLALAMTGEVVAGLEELRSCERRAQSRHEVRLRMDFQGALGHALHLAGRFEEAMAALTAAASLAEQLGDLGEAFEQWGNVATCANSLGQTDDAIRHGERALHFWRRLDQPRSVTAAAGQSQLAASLMGVGRFAEAQTMLHWALACFVESGPPAWRAITEHRLATMYLRLGQPARARQTLSPLADDATAGLRMMRGLIECRIEQRAGRNITANLQALVKELVDESKEPLQPMDRHALWLALAAELPDVNAAALARQVLRETNEQQPGSAGRPDGPAAVHARARLALALAGLGLTDEARQEVRLAWAHAAHTGALDIDRASLCRLIHQAASSAGDARTADAAIRAAEAWIQRALPQVPAALRHGFLRQNPTRRAVTNLDQAAAQ
jgi:DNA-binding SARP family transcriptional activator/tetratricopeptide (TPR) repeat protein